MSEESPRVCVDCGGSGSLGKSTDGRLISCETCGGHEDALGTGIVGNSEIVFQELSALRSKCERLEKALTGLIPKCLNCQKPTAKYLDDEGWICSAKCHDELAGTDGGVITDADLTEDGDALAGIAALATPSVTEKCADGEHVFSVSPPWICLKCGDVAPKSQPSVTPTEGNEKEGSH